MAPTTLKRAIKCWTLEHEEPLRTLVLKALRYLGLHMDETELRERHQGNPRRKEKQAI